MRLMLCAAFLFLMASQPIFSQGQHNTTDSTANKTTVMVGHRINLEQLLAVNTDTFCITQKADIAELLLKHVKNKHVLNGWRVQIFLGRDRQKAEKVLESFQELYPKMNTYLSYDLPYFKVRVGNFRTRQEAFYFSHNIDSEFAATIWVVEENIEQPKLEDVTIMEKRKNKEVQND